MPALRDFSLRCKLWRNKVVVIVTITVAHLISNVVTNTDQLVVHVQPASMWIEMCTLLFKVVKCSLVNLYKTINIFFYRTIAFWCNVFCLALGCCQTFSTILAKTLFGVRCPISIIPHKLSKVWRQPFILLVSDVTNLHYFFSLSSRSMLR